MDLPHRPPASDNAIATVPLELKPGRDLDRLLAIYFAAYRAEVAQLDLPAASPISVKTLDGSLTYLGALLGHTLVGAVGFRSSAPAEIRTLAVDPSMHRKGIASALLRALFAQLDRQDIWVTTAVQNAPARDLYRGAGFVEQGRSMAPHYGVELVHLSRRAAAR